MMTGKYIDLATAIERESPIACGREGSAMASGIRTALRWLDRHSDQAPGRTITESGVESINDTFPRNIKLKAWVIRDIAEALGFTVVPDPEPTNAEKIAEEIDTYMQEHGFGDRPTADDLAAWLDQRGVQAPDGDEQ